MARLFLSHSSANDAAAIALGAWLAEQGFDDVFLDINPDRGLVAGERWQDALKAAADRCEAVLFLVSPSWVASRWCLAEFLLAKTLHKRIFGLIVEPLPIHQLPPEMTAEWQLCDLAGSDRLRSFQVQAPSGPARVAFREAGLDLLRRGLVRAGLEGRSFPWPPPDEPSRAPYRGLKALEPQDAAIFFGRDAEIVRGMDQMRGLAEDRLGAFMVILGASGAGKSSFLRAGLWPRLLRDDVNFLPLPIVRPEATVLTGAAGLAASVTAAFARLGTPCNLGDVKRALWQQSDGLAPLLDSLLTLARRRLAVSQAGKADPALILPLDQAEELFAPEGVLEAERFLALIAPLLVPGAGASRRVLLVATIRSDHFEELQAAPALARIRRELFDLPPMPPGEFKSVIEGPAQRASQAGRALAIAPALTARLMAEAQGADALPLLGFTLERLYEDFGQSGAETAAQYDSLGGVRGVLESAVAASLAAPEAAPAIPADRSAQMAILHAAFIPWLARIDPESRAPRRRVAALTELPSDALPIVARLVEARLLVTDRREGMDVVEVAHESLLRNWPALKSWLEADAADLAMLEGVERAASDWSQNDRAEAWLVHRGVRLAEAERVLARGDFARRQDQIGPPYLAACRSREAAAQAERRAAARRLLRRTQLGLAVSLMLMVAAGIGAWFGLSGQLAFQRQFEIAEGRRAQNLALALKSEANPNIVEAVALSVLPRRLTEHGRQGMWPELLDRLMISANGNMQRLVLGHVDMVMSAQFSPDGQRIVTASNDKIARIWDAASGVLLTTLTGHEARVTSATFSPDGRRIVTASVDNTARVWSAAGGVPLTIFAKHQGAVYSAAFSPDGRRIVTASDDKTARVWDATSGTPLTILTGHEAEVDNAAFSPDGRRIVTASTDKTARVWDAASGALLKILTGHEATVFSAAFSPDGRRIVTASADKTARVWDAASGAQLTILTGHEAQVASAAFSPDGRRIVTASNDKTARIWDAANFELLTTLNGHEATVESAAFSPDGRHIVTASDDKTARVWDVAGGALLTILTGHQAAVFNAAFSPDGRRIVTASNDTTARVWDAASLELLATLTGHESAVYNAAFSPDGQRIVTASRDKTARVWDATSFRLLTTLIGHEASVYTAAFSPDGRRIVTASEDKTARLWDAASGALLKTLIGHEALVTGATFSPDGRHIVTASGDKTALVWDAASFARLTTLTGHEATVASVAFSPDGRRIVTASDDKTARVWDTTSGALLMILTGHEAQVASAAFSPDGRRIVTAAGDKTARVWDATLGSQLMILTGHGDLLESAVFSPDGRRIVTASDDKTVRVWDVPDYLDSNSATFIRAVASRGLDSALRAQYALPAPPQPARPVKSNGCDRIDVARSTPGDNPAAIAAWTKGAQSGDGTCHQRMAERYESGQAIAGDLGKAFFHHALAARLLEEQGLDAAAQQERYRREALAWLLPRQQVSQLMDEADDWTPGQAFPP
jgi:WD40 repeat protein